MSLAVLALLLFVSIFLLVLYGYPVAFTLGGLSLLYAFCFLEANVLTLLPNRVMGVMENSVYWPFRCSFSWGSCWRKADWPNACSRRWPVFWPRRGGMAVSVIVVGALLAASTGIVGATVITMGLISLPPMLRQGYPAPRLRGHCRLGNARADHPPLGGPGAPRQRAASQCR